MLIMGQCMRSFVNSSNWGDCSSFPVLNLEDFVIILASAQSLEENYIHVWLDSAWQRVFKQVELESDSSSPAISLIKGTTHADNVHADRRASSCAVWFANHAFSLQLASTIFILCLLGCYSIKCVDLNEGFIVSKIRNLSL